MMSRMTQQDAFTEPKPIAKERTDSRRTDVAGLSKLFEKLPPHAIEAEMSLIGSMLLDHEVIGDVVQIIKSGEDFFKPAHGSIYDSIVELYDKHSKLDLVSLNQLLIDRGIWEAIGGETYLIDLAESVPSAAHADHYARLVREKAMIRKLIGVAGDIIYDAHNSPDKAQEILDSAEHRIFQITDHYERSDFVQLTELMTQMLENLDDKGHKSGLLTHYFDFDDRTGGLQPGELSILAARPSMGKTALALNLAVNLAEHGHSVGFFSLEMNREQLVQRLVASKASVDVQKLRRNMLDDNERNFSVRDACLALRQLPMFVDDSASLTLMQLRAKARRMRSKHKIEAIFVDYLQLVSLGFRVESRQMEVTEISRGLKALARELNVPVVCLSQLNRGPEQREGHRPRLSDLRESGAIEQDADVVMLLHREDYYHKEDDAWEPNNLSELILAKQRNGPTGVVKLVWDSSSTTFRDYSYSTGADGYMPV